MSVPAGYTAVDHYPVVARGRLRRQVMMHKPGQMSLGAMELSYPRAIEQDGRREKPTQGGLPQGKAAQHPAAFAAALDALRGLWREYIASVSEDFHEALVTGITSEAPELLFASAYDDSQRHGGMKTRLWFSIGEVLLMQAAQLERDHPDEHHVKPLLARFDQARPQWRVEHTANWCSPRYRAALMPYLSNNTADAAAAWADAQRVLVGAAEAIGPHNAATLLAHGAERLADPDSEYWVDLRAKVLASGVDLQTPALTPHSQSAQSTFDADGQPVSPLSQRLASAVRWGEPGALFWRDALLSAQLPLGHSPVPAPVPSL